ncbi:MAG TPA: hypothetical protein VF735_05840 [Pyrinomonadaceae bacterium]|jgi:hypothetical protein
MKPISLISLLLITLIITLTSPWEANDQKPEGVEYYDNYRLFEIYQRSDGIKDGKQKLDVLIEQLKAEPQSDIWLLSYGGRHACVGEARGRVEAVKRYLVNSGISSRRVVAVDAGFHEEWAVELWLVIRCTPGPPPRPSVNRAAVQFIGRSNKQRNRCKKPNRLF